MFAACVDVLDGIMPAHVQYPALDPDCAGFSHYWLQAKLRRELEFTGVIFSDDLSMAAAHSAGNIESRLEAALGAGCDMVLVCNDRDSALRASDWLESAGQTRSLRLAALRGKSTLSCTDLRSEPQWQRASEAIADLSGLAHE